MAFKEWRSAQDSKPRLIFLGELACCGTYVLRIQVHHPLTMAFGRFKDSQQICITPGDYSYVGSARARRGAVCLARRLARHAARIGPKPPHRIQSVMQKVFTQNGMGDGDLRPKDGKTLRWHIDYLLDQMCVDLVAAYMIRSPLPLEAELGRMLANDSGTIVFERGLGATDIPGNTHLLRVTNKKWWRSLPAKLENFLHARV